MRILKTFIPTLVLSLGLMNIATSCSDNNDEPEIPAAKSVVGTYASDITCTVLGQELTFENITYTITATDDTTISLNISSFGNPPMQIPAFTIYGIKVTGSNGKYEFSETDFNGTTDDGKAYSGTIQGNVINNTLSAQFNIVFGSMPMPMICSFTAPKK